MAKLIGFKWVDTGFTHPVDMDTIRAVAYGENGVCLAGAQDKAYLFRSTDYGVTWSSLGVLFSEIAIGQMAYLGNNIWIAGTRNSGKIIRSIDNGVTWSDLGQVTVGQTYITAIYSLGNGFAVAGSSPNGHIFYSSDWGVSWNDTGDLYSQTFITRFCKVSDDYLLAGTSPGGLVLKSIDKGINWSSLGSIGEQNLNGIMHLGGGIIVAATSDATNGARVFRSTNSGVSWTQVATQLINEDSANAVSYNGNGVVVVPTWPKGESWRSYDYGITWESRGSQFSQIDFFDTTYLENGIFIGGTTAGAVGKILRSTEYNEDGDNSLLPWNNKDAVFVLAPNAWSKGNGTVAANTGNLPSYPDDTYQSVERIGMGVGYGFVPNSEDGYENFDGVGDYIQTNYGLAVNGLNTNLTIEMKLNTPLTALTFLWGVDDGTPEIWSYVDTNGSIYFRCKNGSLFDTETNPGAISAAGNHTITWRITNGLMSIFVDGVESGGVGYAQQATITINQTYVMKLRVGTKTGAANFDSKLYWLAVYEDSISLSRIIENHALDNSMGLIGNSVGDVLILTKYVDSRKKKCSIGIGCGI